MWGCWRAGRSPCRAPWKLATAWGGLQRVRHATVARWAKRRGHELERRGGSQRRSRGSRVEWGGDEGCPCPVGADGRSEMRLRAWEAPGLQETHVRAAITHLGASDARREHFDDLQRGSLGLALLGAI